MAVIYHVDIFLMHRFEAEISGPPGIGAVPPLQPPPAPPRGVIGAKTYTQVCCCYFSNA